MNMKQKQRAVIEFLLLEGRLGDDIAIHRHTVSEDAAYSRAAVFRWTSKIRSGNSEPQSDKSPGDRLDIRRMGIFDRTILRDNPFAPLHAIAEMLRISPETVWFHLLRTGFVLKALHWVPHILTDDMKLIRAEMCQTMLAALRVQEHNQWHDIVTVD
jgi:hypothetical protein